MWEAAPRLQRLLVYAVAPFVVLTVAGLVVLWPAADVAGLRQGAGANTETYDATVTEVRATSCEGVAPEEAGLECSEATVRLDEGPDEGEERTFVTAERDATRRLESGDAILVGRSPGAPQELEYFFADYRRGVPLIVLGLVFAAVVVALSRWRGLAALAGLAVSLLVLVRFVLPAILEGSSPLLVTVVGASAIMLATLYLAHGFTVRTTTAILGTLASLLVTGVLAYVFVEVSRFTGLASEEALLLQVNAQQVNLQGLLLGGIIIGALGVLDDVTVTQASAVWELHVANPRYRFGELYASALRIGRDHIASTVNTLVLAYAGSALPLLVLFTFSDRPVGEALTGEVIAEEIVRTLVGSIGLVTSVPITTALASLLCVREHEVTPRSERAPSRRSRREWSPPKAESEWRDQSSGDGEQDRHTP